MAGLGLRLRSFMIILREKEKNGKQGGERREEGRREVVEVESEDY